MIHVLIANTSYIYTI